MANFEAASTLADHQHFASSTSLTVLSLEEVGKMMLVDGLLFARTGDERYWHAVVQRNCTARGETCTEYWNLPEISDDPFKYDSPASDGSTTVKSATSIILANPTPRAMLWPDQRRLDKIKSDY